MAKHHLMLTLLARWGCEVLASQPNFQLMLMMLVFGLLYGPAGASMMPADARDACPSGLASQQNPS